MINEINEKIGNIKAQMAEKDRLERMMEKVEYEINHQDKFRINF